MRHFTFDLLVRRRYQEDSRRRYLRNQLEVKMKKLRIIMWSGLTVGAFYAYLQLVQWIHRINQVGP